jgi:choice-of-anchor C domain-containing protein
VYNLGGLAGVGAERHAGYNLGCCVDFFLAENSAECGKTRDYRSDRLAPADLKKDAGGLGLPIYLALAPLLCYLRRANANFILVNGDFESPIATPPFQTLTGTQLTGWQITTGSIDLVKTYWPAFEGRQSIDLAGSTKNGGAIEQAFATTIGATYLLTFDYANNTDVSLATANVRVFGSSTLLNQDISHFGSTSADLPSMNYTAFSALFTADATSTTLQFTSTGPDPIINRDNGIVLDDVAVTQVTPEPSTMVLLGTGVVGLLVYCWQRAQCHVTAGVSM